MGLRDFINIDIFSVYFTASHELHCKRMTSNCSHICVYAKDVPHFECLCGNGFYLTADDRTCKEGLFAIFTSNRRNCN